MGILDIALPGGGHVIAYPKSDHAPASFTVLNLGVADIDTAVDELNAAGVVTKIYDDPDFGTDARGISRGRGPDIASFATPRATCCRSSPTCAAETHRRGERRRAHPSRAPPPRDTRGWRLGRPPRDSRAQVPRVARRFGQTEHTQPLREGGPMPLIFLCGFVAIALWSLVEQRPVPRAGGSRAPRPSPSPVPCSCSST